MSKSIEEIIKSVNSTRCVGIEICNKSSSKILTSPKTYIYSGKVHTSPSDPINQGEKGVCVIEKRSYSLWGAVGVLSYRIGNTQISVLVSNPYNYFMYSIQYALDVSDEITRTDYNLYKNMYNDLGSNSILKASVESPSNSTTRDIYVSVTMSDEKKAILKMDIRDA
ncbi:hydra actinoporin-like toxin 4 [Mobula hypostoma]|uniref:hydra actinoporin-like toxin 4 n=1 Tax=Mobula hypostoma TaxID=723540 RepID=UPI002FC32EEC